MKPKPHKYSIIARKIDKIAEASGIAHADVPQHPELLKGTGIDQEDISKEDVFEAQRYGRSLLVAIATKYGATVGH